MSTVSLPTAGPTQVELQLFGPPDPSVTQNVAAAMITGDARRPARASAT